jgi:N-acetylglucosaminyl-diphospho-decaprenol L-rhamnosyltransferase
MSPVVVIIVGYRCADEILGCLAALASSRGPAFDVHICENGGEDSFRSLIAAIGKSGAWVAQAPTTSQGTVVEAITFSGIGLFSLEVHRAARNLGYAGGINAVLDIIANDRCWHAVWILNPDTEAAPGALAALEARAKLDRYGIVGGRMVLKHSGRIQMYGGRWRRWIARGWNIGFGRPSEAVPDVDAVERQMDYVCGASMYVTRAFLEAVGRMDERYFLYAEEVDWCFRRGSFRLGYAHDSIVYHTHGATIGSNHDRHRRSPFSVYLDERNRLLITRRFDPVMLPVVALSTLSVVAQQYLLAGAFRNFGAGILGWFAGLRGRTGVPARFASVAGLTTIQQQQKQDTTDVRSTPQARHDVVSNPVSPSR